MKYRAKRVTVVPATATGLDGPTVEAMTFGDWAYHKNPWNQTAPRPSWTVTHVPTGMAGGVGLESLGAARKLALAFYCHMPAHGPGKRGSLDWEVFNKAGSEVKRAERSGKLDELIGG
jgi:hypothetical protein